MIWFWGFLAPQPLGADTKVLMNSSPRSNHNSTNHDVVSQLLNEMCLLCTEIIMYETKNLLIFIYFVVIPKAVGNCEKLPPVFFHTNLNI